MKQTDEKAFIRSAVLTAKALQNKEISLKEFHDFFKKIHAEIDLKEIFSRRFNELKNKPCLTIYKEKDTNSSKKKSIKLQLFLLNRNDSHPPHAHIDIASFHQILSGSIYLRDYSVSFKEESGEFELFPLHEGVRKAGDCSNIDETRAHWFTALEDDTIILNFNVTGFMDDGKLKSRDDEAKAESRVYLNVANEFKGKSFTVQEITRSQSLSKYKKVLCAAT